VSFPAAVDRVVPCRSEQPHSLQMCLRLDASGSPTRETRAAMLQIDGVEVAAAQFDARTRFCESRRWRLSWVQSSGCSFHVTRVWANEKRWDHDG
jgi:hypothetical protein